MATSKVKPLSKLFKSSVTTVKKSAITSVKSSSSASLQIPLANDKGLKHFIVSSNIENSNKSTKPLHDDIHCFQSETYHDSDDKSTKRDVVLNSISQNQNNDEEPSKKNIDIPWFPNASLFQMSIERKKVTRERKYKWIHKNTQEYTFDNLVQTSVRSIGSDTAIELFGKLGRETGVKEYNSLIKVYIDKAKYFDNEDESMDMFLKAYKVFKAMKEQGHEIQEGTYGQLVMFLAERGMVREFYFVYDEIRRDSSKFQRLGYYEMLMWIKVGNEEKIHELCSYVLIGDWQDKSDLIVNYLLALCEFDQKAGLLQLLDVVGITNVSQCCSASIFKALGRLSLNSLAEKFLFDLKKCDFGAEYIGPCILNYIANIPNLEVEDAILEFKNIHSKLDLTLLCASYEMLIMHCCQRLKVNSALELVDEMREAGLTLSLEIIHSILDASVESCDFNLVDRIYSIICQEDNLQPNRETFRLLITLNVKLKDFDSAYRMLNNMEEMNLKPTVNIYNTILAGYYREKNVKGALKVLKQMELAEIKPDSFTYSYLITNSDSEKDIIKYYEELKTNPEVLITKHVYMALINAYANCGEFEKAKQVVVDGVPDKYSSEVKSALVATLSMHGKLFDAFEIYKEIKEAGFKLEPKAAICFMDNIQMDGELSGLLQLLEEIDDPVFWLDGCWRIVLYCVKFKHLSTCVDLLGKVTNIYSNDEMALEALFDEPFSHIAELGSTHLQFGLDLLRDIKAKLDILPSRKCLDFLLSACVEAKDLKSSLLVWKEYKKADLPYNVLSFVRMYQAYLASGDQKSANVLLSRIPKDDYPHVSYYIEACKKAYISKRKTKLKRK